MPHQELVDYSPHNPDPAEPLPNASNLILIDNYDSFTWNLYQYFVLEGANVKVYRNDEIALEELIALNPTQLVISPGPGHPEKDAGVSKAAISHFSGRIPVFGVCMGQQCMYEVFGGTVDVTGEILHGKTSPLRHDGKGVYEGIDQDIPVTRYHSLAGTHPTLPDCLEVSSWVAAGPDGGKGVIMGVRHKELLVEGVQFHPESILTAGGRTMLRNFLQMRGGTWAENERLRKPEAASSKAVNGAQSQAIGVGSSSKKTSVLERIYEHRRAAVAAQKQIPSLRPEDLQAAYDLNLAPPQISFPERLRQSPYELSLMAEIKRASPSKGIISLSTCAPAQARAYALAGASVISVLTEPEWFKGSVEDLRFVRQSLQGMPNRPAVLRKEFIFDEYQILEARLAGADTVLLIVKMLDEAGLRRLYLYSQSLGMEPLVEVNNEEEMRTAVHLGAKVIGVNNRNLTNFEVDMETTSNLMSLVPKDAVVCALSGISRREDVEPYQKNGVGAVLVGEALMRAKDTTKFIYDLLGGDKKPAREQRPELLVKICGTRSPEAARAAVEAGADAIGMILAEGFKRSVPTETALAISRVVHDTPRERRLNKASSPSNPPSVASNHGVHSASKTLLHPGRALLVGVFVDQPLEHVLEQQRLLGLDVVQLHGNEPVEWAGLIPVPVIRRFRPGEPGMGLRGLHALPLFDSGAGSGNPVDLEKAKAELSKDDGVNVLLAGGLDPDNVRGVLAAMGDLEPRIAGVDVSSGVEDGGVQSVEKIRAFIRAAKLVVSG